MCTIGNVFSVKEGAHLVFKQCDLVGSVEFYTPEVKISGDIKYLPFMREGSEGAWCGINNYGVSFVAADSYVDKKGNEIQKKLTSSSDTTDSTETTPTIFDQYMKIISECTTAKAAMEMMVEFYKTFDSPDILLIADTDSSYFIESEGSGTQNVQVIDRTDGHFASTNHFRMVYGAVPYASNHSTYLRLQRAETILQCSPDFDGIQSVLSDRYYGDSVWSVCRTANSNTPAEEES